MNNKLETSLSGLNLKTPLLTCSGTSGSSHEICFLQNKQKLTTALGAFVTKGVTFNPRLGNNPPRIIETRAGILNSIGLQNKGAETFLKKDLPELLRYELPIIVNISAGSIEEFGSLAEYLCKNDLNGIINGIEINVSCPNIKEGGVAFGVDPYFVEKIVSAVRKNVSNNMLIITKLSPNVTDITIPAKAAIEGGTDALSMINTLKGMAIDVHRKKPSLGNKIGGLSGPCIKPVGLFMVYECFRRIEQCRNKTIPIIGIGGISDYHDVLEYIMAGASAVGIGTQWFINNHIFEEIHENLEKYLSDNNTTIIDLIGAAHDKE